MTLSLIIFLVILFFFIANRSTRENPREIKLQELIQTVEAFLSDRDGAYAWEDFLTFPIKDPNMNTFRIVCQKIDWTTQDGKDKVRGLLDTLIGQAS